MRDGKYSSSLHPQESYFSKPHGQQIKLKFHYWFSSDKKSHQDLLCEFGRACQKLNHSTSL